MAACAFIAPVAVAGLADLHRADAPDPYGLSPALVRALDELDHSAVVFAPVETAYRVTAAAPVFVAATLPFHVADTGATRPHRRQRDAIRFSSSTRPNCLTRRGQRFSSATGRTTCSWTRRVRTRRSSRRLSSRSMRTVATSSCGRRRPTQADEPSSSPSAASAVRPGPAPVWSWPEPCAPRRCVSRLGVAGLTGFRDCDGALRSVRARLGSLRHGPHRRMDIRLQAAASHEPSAHPEERREQERPERDCRRPPRQPIALGPEYAAGAREGHSIGLFSSCVPCRDRGRRGALGATCVLARFAGWRGSVGLNRRLRDRGGSRLRHRHFGYTRNGRRNARRLRGELDRRRVSRFRRQRQTPRGREVRRLTLDPQAARARTPQAPPTASPGRSAQGSAGGAGSLASGTTGAATGRSGSGITAWPAGPQLRVRQGARKEARARSRRSARPPRQSRPRPRWRRAQLRKRRWSSVTEEPVSRFGSRPFVRCRGRSPRSSRPRTSVPEPELRAGRAPRSTPRWRPAA